MSTAQHIHDGNQVICVDFLLTMVQMSTSPDFNLSWWVVYRYLSSVFYPISVTLKVSEIWGSRFPSNQSFHHVTVVSQSLDFPLGIHGSPISWISISGYPNTLLGSLILTPHNMPILLTTGDKFIKTARLT